jgi:hypothetical protein
MEYCVNDEYRHDSQFTYKQHTFNREPALTLNDSRSMYMALIQMILSSAMRRMKMSAELRAELREIKSMLRRLESDFLNA